MAVPATQPVVLPAGLVQPDEHGWTGSNHVDQDWPDGWSDDPGGGSGDPGGVAGPPTLPEPAPPPDLSPTTSGAGGDGSGPPSLPLGSAQSQPQHPPPLVDQAPSGPPPLLPGHPAPGSPVLADPGRWYRELTGWWAMVLAVYGPALATATLASIVVAVAASWWARLRRRRRWAVHARWVQITAPPQIDPAGAERLWSTLHALARPRHTRLLRGQPHISFEIHAAVSGLRFGIWVPGVIAPGRVEHMIRAAWPGAQVRAAKKTLPTPIPAAPAGRKLAVAAGRLVLGRHPVLPLRTDHPLDPLRAVLAPMTSLHEGQSGCVQILARPVTGGARATRLRRAAIRLATRSALTPGLGDGLIDGTGPATLGRLALAAVIGLLTGALRAVLDLLTPTRLSYGQHSEGHHRYHRSDRDHRAHRGGPAGTDSPYRRDLVRAAGTKTTAPVRLWAVQIRYTTTLHTPESISEAGWRRAEKRCQAHAGAIADAFSVLCGHNQLRRRRLSRPRQLAALQQRWMGRGQLWSGDELAALAHLPHDPHVPGLARAGAPAVPPAPTIPDPTNTPPATTPTPGGTAGTAAGPGLRVTQPAATRGPGQAANNTATNNTAGTGASPNTASPSDPDSGAGNVANTMDVLVLGDSNASPHRPVGLAICDRCRHLCLLGVNGTGKSTCLCHMVLADAAARRPAILIDPKTDTVANIEHRLPEHARARLVLLDPDADGPPPVLNLLDPHDPVAVDNLVSILAHIYRGSWGEQIAHALKVGCLTVIARYHELAARESAKPQPRPIARPHLGDVVDLFTRDTDRALAVDMLTASDHPVDRLLAGFWAAYENRTPAGREEMAGRFVNKLRGLLLRPFTNQVLCGTGPTLDVKHLLDTGGICLARLPEGVLGSDTTRLLGSLLVAKTWQAVTARASQPEHQRAPAALYLEEAPMFLHMHTPIERMLAQARGYNLGLILALQNLAQTASKELREAISANVLHKIFFRLGVEDAAWAERHTTPLLSAYDLSHLDDFTAAARLHPAGKDTDAFTLRTRPLTPIRRAA